MKDNPMGRKRTTSLSLLLFMAALAAVALVALYRLSGSVWPESFSVVNIPGGASPQKAYFLPSGPGPRRPLLVSLHTWSGDYSQADPLARMASREGWNYIHPDFQGSNRHKDACLSDRVLGDIDRAIRFAKDNGNVDEDNVFIVGLSGGGYTALGAYLRSSNKVKATVAWSPISDLREWFYQTRDAHPDYARDILGCTSDGRRFDEDGARRRSPLFWEMPPGPRGRLEIYAGINDGHDGQGCRGVRR